VTPLTPIAKLAGGLTDIFSASELLAKIDQDARAKRGTALPPASNVNPTPADPILPTRSTPDTPEPARDFGPLALEGDFADDIPDFRSEPIPQTRPAQAPVGDGPTLDSEQLDAEPPDFRETFVVPPETKIAQPKQLQLDQLPKLEPHTSLYSEIIERRPTPGMPANPALITPPAPKRQPSILPVVIVVGVLLIAILVIFVIALVKH
jgi:hypothetical protein